MSGSGEHESVACIGIILDGNRRWAKEKGLPTLEGHRRGFENLKTITRIAKDRGIAHLVVYAFSSENWNRPQDEVAGLMNMIKGAAETRMNDLIESGVRVRFVGDRARLEPDVMHALEKVEQESAAHSSLTLWVCLSYGGRAEIVAAAHAAGAHEGVLSEELLRQHLWTSDMPDPDLIIRTGGQKRLSNFLLWQAAYSELFFLDVLWPDFSEKHLDAVLTEFSERTRNFGV